jgi:hypothetical protein
MILIRDVFRLKFGKAKEALNFLKEGLPINQRLGYGQASPRVLTDITGPYYTLVLETTYETLADYEGSAQKVLADEGWRNWYQRFQTVVESGHREIFKIVS